MNLRIDFCTVSVTCKPNGGSGAADKHPLFKSWVVGMIHPSTGLQHGSQNRFHLFDLGFAEPL